MTTPSQHERIEIWRYTYARSSLIEAREAAKFLIEHPKLPNQIEIPLSSEVVPVEFRDLHNEHLQMRYRTIGHKDAVAFPSTPLNRVIVCVDATGFELRTVSAHTIVDTGLQRTVKLCDYLVDCCASKVQEYCSHFVGVGEGVYVLSIEANPVQWLLKKD